MNVGKATVAGSSSHRSSKLTLTPLTIPPPSFTTTSSSAHVETGGDRSTPALSLETPGRPGSARLAPLRNPPQAPPVVVDQAPNLPDVERAPFVALRLSDGSDSDEDLTFSIDLKAGDRSLHSMQPAKHATPHASPASTLVLPQPAIPASSTATEISSSGVQPAAFLLPSGHILSSVSTPQPKAAGASQQHPAPAPSTAVSALDSALSKREKQLLQLLSPGEQGHLHSHATGAAPPSTSSATSSSVVVASPPASSPSTPAPSNTSTPSAVSLSRVGSDVLSDGSWDDDEAASGARCVGLVALCCSPVGAMRALVLALSLPLTAFWYNHDAAF